MDRPHHLAPPFPSSTWVNAWESIKLSDRVTLIHFWDYTSVDCVALLPDLRAWYDRYGGYDFEMVGVHTPTFTFAHAFKQVKRSMGRLGIQWPVILDNQNELRSSYAVHSIPMMFLIDGKGYLRYRNSGEGSLGQTERAIQMLLMEINPTLNLPEPLRQEDTDGAICPLTTYELPVGALGNSPQPGEYPIIFRTPIERTDGRFYLQGQWRHINDGITFEGEQGMVTIPYHAASVHAVLSPTSVPDLSNTDLYNPIVLNVTLDGNPLPKGEFGEDVYLSVNQTKLRVIEPRLYTLTRHIDVQTHELCLLTEEPGLTLYRFTFGS